MGDNLTKLILDEMDEIRRIDKQNMLDFCIEANTHYAKSWENSQKIKFDYPYPENIILAGMGGSAIGGELVKDYTRSQAKVPIEISRDYSLPAYAGKKSLVILASYSGDTEETLGSLLDALKRRCMIYCVSSGGALIEYAEKLNLPHMKVQGGMQPRAAMPYMLMPLLKFSQELGFASKIGDEFSEATKILKKISVENGPAIPTGGNFAKGLAVSLSKLSPVVYGFGIYRGVALRFKQQFNENAKVPSKWEVFSELNHNETMGWESAKDLAKCFGVVFLRDEAESVEIHSRIETTKTLMESSVANMFEVWVQGKGVLSRMLSAILIGDFTSLYLAYLRGVDPTPVKTVKIMKKRIEENKVKEKILCELEKMSAK